VKITCPVCQSEMSPSSAEIEKRVATCGKCGESLRLKINVAPTKKKDIPQPSEVVILEEREDLLRLRYTPPGSMGWLHIGAGVFWALSPRLIFSPMPVEAVAAFQVFTVLFGFGYILWGVHLLRQRTELSIFRGETKLSSDPFRSAGQEPSPSAIQIERRGLRSTQSTVLTTSISQLYCSRLARRRKGKTIVKFAVEVLLKDGIAENLVQNITTLETAQYIEAKIESFLHIEDAPVPNEASPRS
jgi:DNA-directed RNA polymerase subunit M/transcription elongation factor TFIIS